MWNKRVTIALIVILNLLVGGTCNDRLIADKPAFINAESPKRVEPQTASIGNTIGVIRLSKARGSTLKMVRFFNPNGSIWFEFPLNSDKNIANEEFKPFSALYRTKI